MGQSRLTDVNTAAITYRTKCLMALDKRLYKNCIGAINTMNSLLPPDDGEKMYRIIFDDLAYYKKVNSVFKIECKFCAVEHDYNSVKFYRMNVPVQESIITGQKHMKIWKCFECDKINRLVESGVIEDAIPKPFYQRNVPNPPINNHGLLSNLEFHSDMVTWVWISLNNLEEGFTRFRDDNWKRGGEDYENPNIDTTAEEGQV